MKTGFIGLGAMGAPMARNLHKAGFLTGVWNRTASRASELADELGVTAADSITELATACDCIVLCVSADQDVLDVVERIAPAMAEGGIVIDCSTVSAATAKQAAATLAEHGIGFLDCPVSGGTEGAQKATLAIMCGGEPDVFQRAKPVLDAMGKRIVLMGPAGSGQATKAVNQIMVAGVNQAVAEGMAFAEAHGLDLGKVIDVVGGGAAGSWMLTNRGPNMQRGDYPLGFKVKLHQKDLEICRSMAEKFDVQLPIVEMTLLHYRRLIEQGHGDEDVSSLFRLKQAQFNEGSES
ncbi:MAG: NAD(P)-dependent oxidoreductase [Gammaproteobacteria bacterium]|nr:NAD(P)-dependent oxidoreductase [Gammaproteobacteria bacterium]